MKKYTVFLLILYFFGCATMGNFIRPENRWGDLPGFIYGKMTAKKYNNVWKIFNDQKLDFYCDSQKNTVEIYSNDFIYRNGITFTNESRLELIKNISKYFEWEALAIKENVTLEKEVGQIRTPTAWKSNNSDKWYHGEANIIIKFFSQNTKRHQLLINFSEAHATENYYITNKIDEIYFDKAEVEELNKLLSIENIKSGIEKQKAKASTEMKFK